jgi:hypothetical protein
VNRLVNVTLLPGATMEIVGRHAAVAAVPTAAGAPERTVAAALPEMNP